MPSESEVQWIRCLPLEYKYKAMNMIAGSRQLRCVHHSNEIDVGDKVRYLSTLYW